MFFRFLCHVYNSNSHLWITKKQRKLKQIVCNSICLFPNLNIITRNAQFISYIFITWPTIVILHYLISRNPSHRQHILGMNLLSVAISKILHLYFILLFCLTKSMPFFALTSRFSLILISLFFQPIYLHVHLIQFLISLKNLVEFRIYLKVDSNKEIMKEKKYEKWILYA